MVLVSDLGGSTHFYQAMAGGFKTMVLASDVGNTDTKFGLWDGEWLGIWRRPTHDGASAQDILIWLNDCFEEADLAPKIENVGCVSVVPARISVIDEVSRSLTKKNAGVVSPASVASLKVLYEPAQSLGPDRFANALGALSQFEPPLIVIDFGSATTMDAVTEEGFFGGAILPGLGLQMGALASRTALLPSVPLNFPPKAIGNDTVHAIQSGVLLGHLAAVEGMIARFNVELGEQGTTVATGGFSHFFIDRTSSIEHFVGSLTLDGVIAGAREL